MKRTHRIALLLAGTALIAGAQAASADVRIRIGGGGHVRIGGGGAVRSHWVHRHAPRVRVQGHIWIGGGTYYQPFAQPPPPPPPPQYQGCNCEQPQVYYPIAPQPVGYVNAPVAVAPEAPLPRFGVGAFLGGVAVDGEHEGKDVGLVGQFRLTRGLVVEAEIAKNELEGGARIDRRIMAGLQLELRPHRRLTPYLAGALGTTQVEVGEDWVDHQAMAEIGGGLRYRVSERLSLFGDFRFGQRQLSDNDTPIVLDDTARTYLPENDEQYTRARFGGLVTF